MKNLIKALFGLVVLVGALASILLLLCEDKNAGERYVTIYDDANGDN